MITLSNYIKSLNKIEDIIEPNTKDHSRRTRKVACWIGDQMGYSVEELRLICFGADVHDIGKVGINPRILNKPSKLTRSEFAAIQIHPTLGYEIARCAKTPVIVSDCILWHHKHWDGSGYPDKLNKKKIPVHANIVCVSDVWDAITSNRPYRLAMPLSMALSEMNKCSSWFSPEVYALFLRYVRTHERT